MFYWGYISIHIESKWNMLVFICCFWYDVEWLVYPYFFTEKNLIPISHVKRIYISGYVYSKYPHLYSTIIGQFHIFWLSLCDTLNKKRGGGQIAIVVHITTNNFMTTPIFSNKHQNTTSKLLNTARYWYHKKQYGWFVGQGG